MMKPPTKNILGVVLTKPSLTNLFFASQLVLKQQQPKQCFYHNSSYKSLLLSYSSSVSSASYSTKRTTTTTNNINHDLITALPSSSISQQRKPHQHKNPTIVNLLRSFHSSSVFLKKKGENEDDALDEISKKLNAKTPFSSSNTTTKTSSLSSENKDDEGQPQDNDEGSFDIPKDDKMSTTQNSCAAEEGKNGIIEHKDNDTSESIDKENEKNNTTANEDSNTKVQKPSTSSTTGSSNSGGSGNKNNNSGNGRSGSVSVNGRYSSFRQKNNSLVHSFNASGANESSSSNVLEKINIPKEYPQLLAVPLTKRPLFPGFYKSLYIKDPQVILAIQNLMERRQPYIGIFMAKDEEVDSDTVTDLKEVHRVGVFAQITNVYQAGPDNSALTVVIYPHRRIRAMDLVPSFEGIPAAEVAPVDANKAESSEKKYSTEDATANENLTTSTSAVTSATTTSSSKIIKTKKQAAREEQKEISNAASFLVSPRAKALLPVNQHLENLSVGVADVKNMKDQPCNIDNPVVKALTSEILNVLKEISQINPLLRDQIVTFSIQTGGNAFQDPAKLADFGAAVSSGEPKDLQAVLDSLVIEERLQKALLVLKKELANAKLQQEIAKEVDKKINRKQQEYYLMEQLKGIKKELGMESDGKDKMIEKFKERAAQLNMPENVRKVFDEELNKLQGLEPVSSEFNVSRNYLDWLTQIPWGIHSKENFEIKHAQSVLDEDHYGLKDVKDRILEFIAVGKLRGSVEGKIICLAGPPGVGKTSIGKSIARSLNREFFRFSVGGLSDVAEIRGHRRTYVGAMPGKVIQALKKVQTENPLIMIDEIDKLGRGHQGDPASALLELLDPEQNNSFLDHYMDIPVDLSKVLFVCTSNVLETIPAPLLDRMEVINVSGYIAQEKVAIASKYLAPVAKKAAGLEDKKVDLSEDAISQIIKNYCRESGVRNLKKHIDKIFRKAALKIVQGETENKDQELQILPENLKDYVGSPVFTSDRMYEETPKGVVMGLAWTSLGGSALYIESVLESAVEKDSKPHFHYTGQMGDVMKESAMIAYTYSKAYMAQHHSTNKFFDKASIHLHVPEGATPKDGPSAGVTMTTALLSLALDKPVIPNVAMTGELTLTGKVLKIGGVKEKTIAAKRSGVTTIIFPEPNKNDWDELDDHIKEGLTPNFVKWYPEIAEIVFAEKFSS